MMKHCAECVIPDTRPGIKFNKDGVCQPCLNAKKLKKVNWDERQKQLAKICDKYRRSDGYYDCVIPASGGKDSFYQTYLMKKVYDMNPLVVKVCDSFTPTKVGEQNLYKMCESFDVDLIRYNLKHETMRKMVRIAFEHYGAPNWPIDIAIYSVPLKIAHQMQIPLVCYGENISYFYGGPESSDTLSAKNQILNNVVKPIDWDWWESKGVTHKDIEFITYPEGCNVDELDPIYLSYFYPWDGRKNYEFAQGWGFRNSNQEWCRKGFIENWDQIDSLGYVIHPQLKYPKFGHARVTDVACNWVRNGYINRNEAVKLVKEHDHKLDPKALCDFLEFTGYTQKEFYNILDRFYNKKLFKKVDGKWCPRFKIV